MAHIMDSGIGTGCSDGYVSGKKDTFANGELVWAGFHAGGCSGTTKLTISWFHYDGFNWNLELSLDHWGGAGWSEVSICSSYYPLWQGNWKVYFLINDASYDMREFTYGEISQDYSVDGTPSGAEIWEESDFIGTAPMVFSLSYTDHYLTFKKVGYYDQTTHVGIKPYGETINVLYNLDPITFNIKESIYWQAITPAPHPFYLLSFYGTNTNNLPGGFQIEKEKYVRITTPSMPRRDDIVTSNVSKFDCLTFIADGYDGSTVYGIYDWRIDNEVV